MRQQSLVVLGRQIAQEWASARPRHNDLWSVPVFGDVTLTAILTGFTMGYSRPRASGGIIAGLLHLAVNWVAMLAAVGFWITASSIVLLLAEETHFQPYHPSYCQTDDKRHPHRVDSSLLALLQRSWWWWRSGWTLWLTGMPNATLSNGEPKSSHDGLDGTASLFGHSGWWHLRVGFVILAVYYAMHGLFPVIR